MSRHKLTSYRASLVEVLRAQVKSQRLEPGLQGVMDLVDSVALKVSHVTEYPNNMRVTVLQGVMDLVDSVALKVSHVTEYIINMQVTVLQGVMDLVDSVALKVSHVTKYSINMRVTVQGFCHVVWCLC